MKHYTKQITAFAVLSLFAYSANAQSATFKGLLLITGPTSGLTIAPAAPGVIPDVSIDAGIDPIDNVVATTAVVDPNTGAITTTIVNQVATYNNTFDDVVVTDIDGIAATETVIINSEGIDLNSSTTTPNTVTFDIRVSEVSINDGLGNTDSITSTFTATAVDPAGVAIQTIAPVTGTDVADALANMEASLVGLAQDNTAVLGSVTTPGTAVSGGGDLNVSGNLAVGAIGDVEQAVIDTAQAVTDNADDITTLNGDVDVVGSVDNKVAALANGAVQNNADDITTLNGDVDEVGSVDNKVAALANGAVQNNADDITTLNGNVDDVGSVANSIASALDDTGVSENGIVGVIEKRADGTVKLGENSFIFDDTTASHVLTADGAATEIVLGGDAPATAGVESVNIRVANNLQVDGNANVDGVLSLGDSGNGAVADVAQSINNLVAEDINIRNEFAAEDTNIRNEFAAEDTNIRNEFAAEDTNIRNEFAAEDTNIRNEFAAEDTNIRNEFAAEDTNIRNEFAAEDTNIRNEFAAGDLFLQDQVTNNAGAIANNSSRIASNKEDIEQNTRGIAMVAALQHTTVLPGMTNAFDLSAAHFEGETGLALNYARRINENVQINFGAASTTDFDESVIKAGIGVQW